MYCAVLYSFYGQETIVFRNYQIQLSWIITTVSIVFAHILVGFGKWLESIVSMVKTFAVYCQAQAQDSYGFCLAPQPKNTLYDVESAANKSIERRKVGCESLCFIHILPECQGRLLDKNPGKTEQLVIFSSKESKQC